MNDTDFSRALLGLTAKIVAAHLAKNPIAEADLPGLIRQVHEALVTAGAPRAAAAEVAAAPPPAPVTPRRTIYPDYIICLEDGRKLKTLKRHLRSTYDLSPEQYREKWGLPADYPMVAPSYAARRSTLAKSLGLGRKAAAASAPAVDTAEEEEPLPQMPTYTIVSPAPPAPRETPAPAPTLENVFAKFTTLPAEAEAEEAAAPADSTPKRPQRKPFSKQLARSMRP